jgi:hypothetical protein
MYTDGQTDRLIYGGRTDMSKLMDAFRDCVNAPKKAAKFVRWTSREYRPITWMRQRIFEFHSQKSWIPWPVERLLTSQENLSFIKLISSRTRCYRHCCWVLCLLLTFLCFQVPPCDLFELHDLSHLSPDKHVCVTSENDGCYLAYLLRKVRSNSLHCLRRSFL